VGTENTISVKKIRQEFHIESGKGGVSAGDWRSKRLPPAQTLDGAWLAGGVCPRREGGGVGTKTSVSPRKLKAERTTRRKRQAASKGGQLYVGAWTRKNTGISRVGGSSARGRRGDAKGYNLKKKGGRTDESLQEGRTPLPCRGVVIKRQHLEGSGTQKEVVDAGTFFRHTGGTIPTSHI